MSISSSSTGLCRPLATSSRRGADSRACTGTAALGPSASSNFHADHLRRLLDETETIQGDDQIEAHPYLTQEPLRAFNASHGIKTEAWSPARPGQGAGRSDHQGCRRSDRSDSGPGRVRRWHIQLGNIVFPKPSSGRIRIEENFNIFDFELSGEDMAAIPKLDPGECTGLGTLRRSSTCWISTHRGHPTPGSGHGGNCRA